MIRFVLRECHGMEWRLILIPMCVLYIVEAVAMSQDELESCGTKWCHYEDESGWRPGFNKIIGGNVMMIAKEIPKPIPQVTTFINYTTGYL